MPIVEQVASKAGDKAHVVKVNVDEASDIAENLGVSSIPTLVIFRNRKQEKRFVGVQSADTLSRALGLQ
jgi:thioredoxin 1